MSQNKADRVIKEYIKTGKMQGKTPKGQPNARKMALSKAFGGKK